MWSKDKKIYCKIRKKPLETLAKSNQLSVFKHNSFWHPMDTLRDKNYLNDMWQNNPLWKKWD